MNVLFGFGGILIEAGSKIKTETFHGVCFLKCLLFKWTPRSRHLNIQAVFQSYLDMTKGTTERCYNTVWALFFR